MTPRDCLDVLPTLAAASVNAVVTDPPYGIGAAGVEWDGDLPPAAVWREVRRVLRPRGRSAS